MIPARRWNSPFRQFCACMLVAITLIAARAAAADDPYTLIMKGRLTEASDSLAKASTSTTRDGNLLFAEGALERDASKAAKLMRAALDGTVSKRYQEVIYLRLAQYYLMSHDYGRLDKLASEYRERWRDGMYLRDMARLSLVADEERRDFDAAQKELTRIAASSPKGDEAQAGEIDRARVAVAGGGRIPNMKALRKIAQQRSGEAVTPALYLLATQAISDGKVDDAMLDVNVLREQFPTAIGLDALEERLGSTNTDKSADARANKLTGTFYSVKVGVFLNAGNAREFGKKFASSGEPVDAESKLISGKNYQVVYVGHCPSFEEARKLKDRLEQLVPEQTFQVVAR